jgi:hypothetical protein
VIVFTTQFILHKFNIKATLQLSPCMAHVRQPAGMIQIVSQPRWDTLRVRRDDVMDLIPVDHVASAILAAAHRASIDRGVTVYQVASGGSVNPLHYSVMADAVG